MNPAEHTAQQSASSAEPIEARTKCGSKPSPQSYPIGPDGGQVEKRTMEGKYTVFELPFRENVIDLNPSDLGASKRVLLIMRGANP